MNAFVTIDAKPEPTSIDLARTAVIVVDMQNDFGAEGGMFARAGIDIVPIRKAIEPTKAVLTAARRAGVKEPWRTDGSQAHGEDPAATALPLREKVNRLRSSDSSLRSGGDRFPPDWVIGNSRNDRSESSRTGCSN